MRPAHYMVHVRDLPGAVAFYERALGFTVADRHQYEGTQLVYMRGTGSGFELELIAPDLWPYAEAPEPGRTHFALTVEDLGAEHARLRALGIDAGPITDYVANGHRQTRYFYVCDPEGNEIELLEAYGRYASNGS